MASMISTPQLWIKLSHLASFIHDSYPKSRLLSAPPLAPWFNFASLLAPPTPESHCLPWLLWLRVLVRQGVCVCVCACVCVCVGGGGGGEVALRLGHPPESLRLGHPPESLRSMIFTLRWF